MRMAPLSVDEAARVIRNACDLGVTFFDHATCYTNGECGQRFGDAFPKTGIRRGDIVLRSGRASPGPPWPSPGSCGIRQKCRPSWAR